MEFGGETVRPPGRQHGSRLDVRAAHRSQTQARLRPRLGRRKPHAQPERSACPASHSSPTASMARSTSPPTSRRKPPGRLRPWRARPSKPAPNFSAASKLPASPPPPAASPPCRPPTVKSRQTSSSPPPASGRPRLAVWPTSPIPLSPLQHLYAVTAPLPELAGVAKRFPSPCSATRTRRCIFGRWARASASALTSTKPLLLDAADLPDCTVDGMPPAEMPFPPAHFEAALTATAELLPSLKDVELTRRLNGIFSFTNDGFPVLGESPRLPGFWSAQAVWNHTPPAGWARRSPNGSLKGSPRPTCTSANIRRFHPHALSRPYVRARAAQQYPRGLRHHPPSPADDPPPQPAPDAVPRTPA